MLIELRMRSSVVGIHSAKSFGVLALGCGLGCHVATDKPKGRCPLVLVLAHGWPGRKPSGGEVARDCQEHQIAILADCSETSAHGSSVWSSPK